MINEYFQLISGLNPTFITYFCMIDEKKGNLLTIQQMVRDFGYGHLDNHNKPSLVKLDKKNSGQNASHCESGTQWNVYYR